MFGYALRRSVCVQEEESKWSEQNVIYLQARCTMTTVSWSRLTYLDTVLTWVDGDS